MLFALHFLRQDTMTANFSREARWQCNTPYKARQLICGASHVIKGSQFTGELNVVLTKNSYPKTYKVKVSKLHNCCTDRKYVNFPSEGATTF